MTDTTQDPGQNVAQKTGQTPPPGKKCPELPKPPKTPELPKDKVCPTKCSCPSAPPADADCISTMLSEEERKIAELERTKSFKTELEDLKKKVKGAREDYTSEKRKKLVALWQTADAEIVELIRKLVCAVDCWYCLIECRVCSRLNDIRRLELRLNGDGTLGDKVHSLYDLQYWQQRNVALRREVFERIRAVLVAWEKPAATLEKALTDNAKLIEDARKVIATDSASAVYDVFMRIVPLHIAIKPPEIASAIDQKYRKLCDCYPGTPDACCGPDVGEQTVLQRLIGLQPYLIKVEDLEAMFCCLVTERYRPARDALSAAEIELLLTDSEIKRLKTDIEDRKKSLPSDFRAGLTTPIDCSKYPKPKDPSQPTPPQNTCRTQQPQQQQPYDPTQQG